MQNIIELVREHLERHDIKARVENGTLVCDITSEHGLWHVVVDAEQEGNLLSVISLLPMRVPDGQRMAFAVELVRLNAGRRLGNWQMNLDGGQLFHCVSVPLAGLAENLEPTMESVFSLALSDVAALMARVADHGFRWGGSPAVQTDAVDSVIDPGRIQFN